MNDIVGIRNTDVQIVKDKLVRDLRNTIADTEELLRVTAGQVGERVADVRAKAQASLDQVRGQLVQLQTQATQRGRQASMQVDTFVHTNAWKTIGVVGLVGLIVGVLIARR